MTSIATKEDVDLLDHNSERKVQLTNLSELSPEEMKKLAYSSPLQDTWKAEIYGEESEVSSVGGFWDFWNAKLGYEDIESFEAFNPVTLYKKDKMDCDEYKTSFLWFTFMEGKCYGLLLLYICLSLIGLDGIPYNVYNSITGVKFSRLKVTIFTNSKVGRDRVDGIFRNILTKMEVPLWCHPLANSSIGKWNTGLSGYQSGGTSGGRTPIAHRGQFRGRGPKITKAKWNQPKMDREFETMSEFWAIWNSKIGNPNVEINKYFKAIYFFTDQLTPSWELLAKEGIKSGGTVTLKWDFIVHIKFVYSLIVQWLLTIPERYKDDQIFSDKILGAEFKNYQVKFWLKDFDIIQNIYDSLTTYLKRFVPQCDDDVLFPMDIDWKGDTKKWSKK